MNRGYDARARFTKIVTILAALNFFVLISPAPTHAEATPAPPISSTCKAVDGVVRCTCTGPAACRLMEDTLCKRHAVCTGNTCTCDMRRVTQGPKVAAPKTGGASRGTVGN